MSISPLVMVAGIQATANVLQTGIRGLQESFRQWLAPDTPPSSQPQQQTDTTQDGSVQTVAGLRLADWARRQAIAQKLAELSQQVSQILPDAGIPFEAPIELQYDGDELAVRADTNPLAGQLETYLQQSDALLAQLKGLRQTLNLPGILRLSVAPNQPASVLPSENGVP